MYKKILVPLDGSKLSEGILPYARALAGGLQIPVDLLTAIDPVIVKMFMDPSHGRYVDAVESDFIRNGTDYLENIAHSFPDRKSVICTVKIGKPMESICGEAAARETLIAMSTHGRAGVQRWFLGSVADKVLHATTSDLLLVRPGKNSKVDEKARFETVVLPLDGSTLAEVALRRVARLAKHMNFGIILLRVFSLPVTSYYGDDGYVVDIQRLLGEVKSEAKSYLDAKQTQLQDEGLKNVSTVLLEGDAPAQIIDYASITPDNLVAMCTHGRSGLGRLVLGSVTDRVVRHSGDPVLVIRAGE
jgi:nucleotide-binding universal stress UspA family protein